MYYYNFNNFTTTACYLENLGGKSAEIIVLQMLLFARVTTLALSKLKQIGLSSLYLI